MSYTIYKSDGTLLTTITDGNKDTTSTNLTLPGPNYVGYGLELNENLIHILENFAANSAPAGTNIEGQLWFNKSNQTLNVFTNQGFLPVSGVTNSGIAPAKSKDGDIWFDNTNNQMYLKDSGTFKLVGPTYTKAMGPSGAFPVVVEDGSTSGVTHNIIQVQFGNTTIATFSTDNSFIPSPGIPGFSRINPGITINNTIANPTININVVGSVTGNVTGSLIGDAVVATNLYGNLTGNVAGNLVGTSVVATTITGSLVGDTLSTNSRVTNFSTANAQITSGNVTGLTNLTATNITNTNFSSSNVQITSGNVVSLTNLSATSSNLANLITANATVTTLTATNLTSSNAQIVAGNVTVTNVIANVGTFSSNLTANNVSITNGNISSLTNLSATNGTFSSITTGTISVTGGSLTGLTNTSTTNSTATNLVTGNAQITGGNIFATPVSGSTGAFTTAVASNFSTANAQVTGGSIVGLATLGATSATLATLTATTLTATSGNVNTLVSKNFSSSNVVITGGSLNATQVGLSTPAAAAFTTVGASGVVSITNTTASNSTGTGALQVAGGLGVAGAVYASSFNGSGAGLTNVPYAASAGNGGVTSVNGQTGAVGIAGLGLNGTTWHAVSRAFNTQYTNTYSYPIAVSATATCSVTSTIQAYVNGQLIQWFQWQFNGCGSFGGAFIIVPPGATYQLNSGQGVYNWVELY